VRPHDQFDVKPLLERLQPVEDQARANIGLVGGEGLDQGLAAGTLEEQFHVDILASVEPFGDAKRQRRMTGRHFGPG
jgi:hypothetical protein